MQNDPRGKLIGLMRNIDDLGRIVIPKEYRRELEIMEGDALEMFLYEGGVFVRKAASKQAVKGKE